MDYYLDEDNSISRIIQEYKKYDGIVVAFDFDDTVFDYHGKGRVYQNVVSLLRELKEINCYLICWTGNEDVKFVEEYLKSNQIPFDVVNENPPFYKSKSRKIYANAFLDDRAGLRQVYEELNNLLLTVKSENI